MTIKRIINIIMLLLFLLISKVVVYDILVHKSTTYIPKITVGEGYISTMFTALCTIAALGSAIMSIVIGAFSYKINGYTVKEIITLKSCPVKIINIIVYSLLSIIIAIPAYIYGFGTFITVLVVTVTAAIAMGSWFLWSILSNEKNAIRLIKTDIEISANEQYADLFARWYPEIEWALEGNNIVECNKFLELVSFVIEIAKKSNINYVPALETRVKKVFPKACKIIGFVDAFHSLITFNDWGRKIDIDYVTIVKEYFDVLQFCDASTIHGYRIPATIEDIIERMGISDEIILRFLYQIFIKAVSNKIVYHEALFDILNSVIQKLCYLRDKANGSVREKVLLYIFRFCIIEIDDINEQQELFHFIIRSMYEENRYSRDACFISTLSQMFRALYFYAILEKETLKTDYRDSLKKFFTYHRDRISNIQINLNRIVGENYDNMIKWYIGDAENAYQGHTSFSVFDYFPINGYVKFGIWTKENIMQFAFSFYAVLGQDYLSFSVPIVNNEVINLQIRQSICRFIVDIFEPGTAKPKDFIMDTISSIQECLNTRNMVPWSYLTDSFYLYNQLLDILSKKAVEKCLMESSISSESINSELYQTLSDIKIFHYDPTINLESGKDVQCETQIVHRTLISPDNAAKNKKREIIEAINHMIDSLPPLNLSFDIDGVNSLLGKLGECDYQWRNYTFVDDWAIKANVRDTHEYEELCKIIKTIPGKFSYEINSYAFLRVEKILYNVSVIYYSLTEPTLEYSERYALSFKIADGKYRVDGVVRNLTETIDWIKTSYMIEESSFRIATNICSDIGFRVTHSSKI